MKTWLNKFIVDFKIYILFFFVYSGLLKWIPFPIDLTLLFGLLCFLFLVRDVLLSKNVFRDVFIIIPVFLFSFFCLWYLLTGFYTVSKLFWIEKSKSIILLIISFFYPIYCLRSYSFLEISKKFLIFSIFALIVLLVLQFNGLLGFITAESDEFRIEYNIPDYLSISEMLICGFLLSLLFKNKLFIIYRFLVVFIIIQLGGRAPILFLGFSYIVYIVLNVKWNLFKLKNISIAIIAFASLVYVFINWEGAELLKSRFFSLQSFQEDESSATRIMWMKESLNLISSHPFFGIGIGGAGIELIGYDENAYPHNHFIETYLESGLLGFLLIIGFWICIFSLFKFFTSDKSHFILSLIILFLFFNYMKSGSYSDIRKMFVWVGLLLTYLNYISYRKYYDLSTTKLDSIA